MQLLERLFQNKTEASPTFDLGGKTLQKTLRGSSTDLQSAFSYHLFPINLNGKLTQVSNSWVKKRSG